MRKRRELAMQPRSARRRGKMRQSLSLKQLNEAPLKQGEPLRHGEQSYLRRAKAERARRHFVTTGRSFGHVIDDDLVTDQREHPLLVRVRSKDRHEDI